MLSFDDDGEGMGTKGEGGKTEMPERQKEVHTKGIKRITEIRIKL